MNETNKTATKQEWNMSNQKWQDLNEKLTESMIQAIINRQIAYACETDKMADIHIGVTVKFRK